MSSDTRKVTPPARVSVALDGAGAPTVGNATSGVQVLQRAPDAEATFYSLPYIEALRACVRQWNATAGGEHVYRSGSTAGGLAGQGTGSHVLTQDHLAVEGHYEEYYSARHPAVVDGTCAWPCPVHAAPHGFRSSLVGSSETEDPAVAGAGTRRGSRHPFGVDAQTHNAAPAATSSGHPPQRSGSRAPSASPGVRESGDAAAADVPEVLDLTTPMGIAWMLGTAGQAEAPAADSSVLHGHDHSALVGLSASPRVNSSFCSDVMLNPFLPSSRLHSSPASDVAQADAEAASALRTLHAGLRRALGFPAKDESLLVVDDLLLDCRSHTLASYARPHLTAPRAGSDCRRAGSHHVDAAHGTTAIHSATPTTTKTHREGPGEGRERTAADEGEFGDDAATLVQRSVPDDAWRAAALPVPPTLAERTPHWCMWRSEESDAALRESAVLQWFSDILQFADRLSFSTVQTRCLLLDAVGLIETLHEVFHTLDANQDSDSNNNISDVDMAARAREEDDLVETAITTSLQDALSAQACPVALRVMERQSVEKPVSRDVPDPAVVGPLERRLATEKLNKKQQQQLREQIAEAPLITQHEMESVMIEVERDMTVGPYFNLHETAAILTHLTASVATHWRLWRLLLTTPQPRVDKVYTMTYQDSLPFCVPPLAQFCPDAYYGNVLEHQALYVEACRELEDAFESLYTAPMRELAAEKQRALAAMRRAQKEDMRENNANTLTAEEFDKVERAFLVRLNQKLAHHAVVAAAAKLGETMPSASTNATLNPGEDGATGFAATAPADGERRSLTPTPPSSSATGKAAKRRSGKPSGTGRGGSAGAGKGQNSLGATLEASRVAAESVVLPADAVFSVEEVEKRVDAAQHTLNAKLEAAANTKKKGK